MRGGLHLVRCRAGASTSAAIVALLTGSVGARAPAQTIARDSRADTATAHGAASIRGRVLAAASGATPIRSARVSLAGGPHAIEPIFSDGSGRFEFTALDAGRYTIAAEKSGFAATRYGATNALDAATPIEIADGESVAGIEIRMTKGAAIHGRVVDDLGDAVAGAIVSAGVLRIAGGETQLVNVSRGGIDTDDRGEYRIGGLAPGRYIVSVAGAGEGAQVPGAPPEWARGAGWGRTFYFGSETLAGATPVVVGAGEERGGVDIALASVRPAKLSVSVLDASGAPTTALVNLLMPGDAPGSILDNRGVPLSPANPRMTPTLPPGDWIAVALGGARALAHVRLASGDQTSLTLMLGSGARISGRVIFDGGNAPPFRTVRLAVRGVGPDAAVPAPGLAGGPAAASDDGSFEMKGVIGTIELEPASAVPGWTLRAVRYGDRDLLDDPLTLVGGEDIAGVQAIFTDRSAAVSGTVAAADGGLSPGCSVVVFPDGKTTFVPRRARLLRADHRGRFTVADLPNGSYFVAATPDVDPAVWATADYSLRLRAIAERVALADRDVKHVALQCTPLP